MKKGIITLAVMLLLMVTAVSAYPWFWWGPPAPDPLEEDFITTGKALDQEIESFGRRASAEVEAALTASCEGVVAEKDWFKNRVINDTGRLTVTTSRGTLGFRCEAKMENYDAETGEYVASSFGYRSLYVGYYNDRSGRAMISGYSNGFPLGAAFPHLE